MKNMQERRNSAQGWWDACPDGETEAQRVSATSEPSVWEWGQDLPLEVR